MPARRTPLTRARIADAAAQLIERDGVAALTMRGLGAALGVEAMALYNHVDSRDALLDAVADGLFARLAAPAASGPWDRRLAAMAAQVRALALASPRVFQLSMTRPTKPASSLPLVESMFGALEEAGLDPAARALAYVVIVSFIRGSLLWEIEQRCQAPALPAGASPFPRATAAYARLGELDPDALFAASFDAVLEGVRSLAAPSTRCTRRAARGTTPRSASRRRAAGS